MKVKACDVASRSGTVWAKKRLATEALEFRQIRKTEKSQKNYPSYKELGCCMKISRLLYRKLLFLNIKSHLVWPRNLDENVDVSDRGNVTDEERSEHGSDAHIRWFELSRVRYQVHLLARVVVRFVFNLTNLLVIERSKELKTK